jgi:hypothetical protein
MEKLPDKEGKFTDLEEGEDDEDFLEDFFEDSD